MKMSLVPVEWDDSVAAHIAAVVAAGHCKFGLTVDWYRAEHEAGRLALVAAMVDGVHCATAGYRFEGVGGAVEMVIVAAGGANGDVGITEAFLPALETIAIAGGASTMRFHTLRKGLVVVSEELGYHLTEYVMRKDLADGR